MPSRLIDAIALVAFFTAATGERLAHADQPNRVTADLILVGGKIWTGK